MCKLRQVLVLVWLASVVCVGQDTSNGEEDLARLKRELQQTRAELAESKQQIETLRTGLEELRKQVQSNSALSAATKTSDAPVSEGQTANTAEPTTAAADQNPSVLAAKVGELHQDKVESASRYSLKLSGLVLFNSYWNRGSLDIQDLPNLTFPTRRDFRMAMWAPHCARRFWGLMQPDQKYGGRGVQLVFRLISEAVARPQRTV